jgi:DNA end-binding protein Ku
MARRKAAAHGKTSATEKSPRGKRRTIWNGQLRLALVSVPVALVPATRSSAHIALHQIHEDSGQRIRYEKVAPGVGPVDKDDIKRGVEVSKGHYVILEDKELETLKLEAKRTLELVQFVDASDIDPIWFEKPYFVLPDGDLAQEPYGVLRDALKALKKVGIGQFVMRGRDYVAALKPCGAGMMLETLRFADEVESASKVFAEVERARPERDLVELAQELIERKTKSFDPAVFHDRYREALAELVAMHQRHEKPVELEEEEEPAGKVIDLVEALRRSVRSSESGTAPSGGAKRRKAS